MMISKGFKPWLAACGPKGVGRDSIKGVYYDHEKRTLTATDGHALIIVPVTCDDDDISGIIPADALKEAAKIAKANAMYYISIARGAAIADKPGEFYLGAAVLPDKRSYPMVGEQYPNVEQVLPRLDGKRTARVRLDPELLATLAQAAGIGAKTQGKSTGVILEFELDADNDARNAPMLVGGLGDRITGIIMPMGLSVRYPLRVDDIDEAHAAAVLENSAPCSEQK